MEKQKNTITIKLQRWIYGLSISAYRSLIKLASIRSTKAQKWISGRRDWRSELKQTIDPDKPKILVHAASLGEMEQGLPVVKRLRQEYPHYQLILSFFSPSGYEHFQEREYCDAVIYLPEDSASNARDFAKILNAKLALFIKYEIWPNLIQALKDQKCRLILAPANFRDDQVYFKFPKYNWLSGRLNLFDEILVQNQKSLDLLRGIGIQQVSICGDSRFERSMENKLKDFSSASIENFIRPELKCLIAGSTWPKEEEICLKLLRDLPEIQIILAPHNVNEENIKRLSSLFKDFKPILLSENKARSQSKILIVDGIGKLRYLYRYGDLAFIGGGFGKSVHSTVEAAVYQIPIFFGPKHQKFPETMEMQDLGFAVSIANYEEAKLATARLLKQSGSLEFNQKYEKYLLAKKGATEAIVKACQRLI